MRRFIILIIIEFACGLISAANYSIKFKDSGTSSDNGVSATRISDIVAETNILIDSIASYKIFNARQGFGIKLGASSSAGSITIHFNRTIYVTRLSIRAAAYKTNETSINVMGYIIDSLEDKVLNDYIIEINDTISYLTIQTPQKRAYLESILIHEENTSVCSNPAIIEVFKDTIYEINNQAEPLCIYTPDNDVTLQWYSNTFPSIEGASLIPNATNESFTPTTSSIGCQYYFCIASHDECITISKLAKVQVVSSIFLEYLLICFINNDSILIPLHKIHRLSFTPSEIHILQSTNLWHYALKDINKIAYKTTYRIRFLNDNGALLQESEVESGTMPIYKGEEPTKEPSIQYSYVFLDWNKEISMAYESTTYVATYSAYINQYTITAEPLDFNMGTVMGGGTYDYNSKVTITAYPSASNKFLQWDDGNVDNPRTIIVTNNSSYFAIFDSSTDNNCIESWTLPSKFIDENHHLIIVKNGKNYSICGIELK